MYLSGLSRSSQEFLNRLSIILIEIWASGNLWFVPHALNHDQNDCRHIKIVVDVDPDFMSETVTGKEKWYFQYDPLMKSESK